MRKLFIFFGLCIFTSTTKAQAVTENIIIITLDGFRWQELFDGADETLINQPAYTNDAEELKKQFWADSVVERRKKLLPFFWSTVAEQGQIYGNRLAGNFVNVKNPYWFSYPGYNEIFTGYPDTLVNSNDKKHNANTTVLDYLHSQPALKGKVAAFASWDVFNFIFNEKRAGFPVNAGIEPVPVNTSRFALLNEMQQSVFQPFGDGIRPDALTYSLAKEYLLVKKPKVLFIGFDDTDDWAHLGNYNYYLQSAHLTDKYLADLWQTIQSLPEYKDKTTLIIASDHGRGDEVKKEWKDHGRKIKGADQIWFAFLGKGIPAKGEVKESGQLYQAQLAQTIAQLLGYQFTANHPIAESLIDVIE